MEDFGTGGRFARSKGISGGVRGSSDLSMLRAAAEGETGFTVDDCELLRPPPILCDRHGGEIQRREERRRNCLSDRRSPFLPRSHGGIA